MLKIILARLVGYKISGIKMKKTQVNPTSFTVNFHFLIFNFLVG